MLPSGIRFNDCVFGEPIPIPGSALPRCAGLYVILVEDRNWAPRPFQPVLFGEFGNNSQEGRKIQENATVLNGLQARTLFLSVLPLPFSTTAQRWALCGELVRAYNPLHQASETHRPPTDLIRKLDELERSHREQTAQLWSLRASADYLLGAAPEHRRRIGFQPEPVRSV